MMDEEDEEICRVCRSTASPDRPLFHPCICTGSIRHVHQDCLVQWLRHSRKEYCELCKHKYTFKPIYSPDMPNRLPLRDLFMGLSVSIGSAVKCWLHYTLVAVAWLGIVPLTASRIYNCVFAGSVSALTSLPKDMISTKNIGLDILHGCVVVTCTLSAFICLVWLRVQILNGELPAWLRPRPEVQQNEEVIPAPQNNDVHLAPDNDLPDVDDNNNANGDVQENVPEEQGNVPEDQEIQENLPAQQQNNFALDNINWNAVDWERGGEDATWERILGLDGSFLFLEHVFWVVALNTLFILVFAFCPYHLGHFFLLCIDLNSYILATGFDSILTTLCGYILIAGGFLTCHFVLQITKFHWPGWMFGLCYVILKVGLLFMVEIGVFPLACGVWLDICTLKVFNCSLQSRQESYLASPGVSIFFHWLIGMAFVFYFATFLMLLREVLRPGALWFLRNLNDPDFNPINEMIHLPIYRHCRRFLVSIVIFGSMIIIIAWLPVHLLLFVAPTFFPYNSSIQGTSPIGDFPLQLIVLHIMLPGLLDQGNTRTWLKRGIRYWAYITGTLFGVKSYLLGEEGIQHVHVENFQNNPQQNLNQELHGEALVQNDWDVNQPYVRPKFFAVRIILVIVSMAVTLTLISSSILLIPVILGRYVFEFLFGATGMLTANSGESPFVIHELYTFATGLYLCWSCVRLYSIALTWAPRGWKIIQEKIVDFLTIVWKSFVLGVFILGVMPLLLGLIFDLVMVIPMRVPSYQTPVILLWQDWALGIFLLKLGIASLLVGPATWLKHDMEQAYQLGIRHLNLFNCITRTILPVILGMLCCLAGPYFIGHIIPILFECSLKLQYFFHWQIYPILILSTAFAGFLSYEVKQFHRLCDHIKNERYLIGKRLQDYDPSHTQKVS